MLTVESVGNDGPWSAHEFFLGTPPQALKMVVSTSSPETWVIDTETTVINPDAWSNNTKACETDSSGNCIKGGAFEPKNSSTWIDSRGLPSRGFGKYGTDVVHINGNISDHFVAQIDTSEFSIG